MFLVVLFWAYIFGMRFLSLYMSSLCERNNAMTFVTRDRPSLQIMYVQLHIYTCVYTDFHMCLCEHRHVDSLDALLMYFHLLLAILHDSAIFFQELEIVDSASPWGPCGSPTIYYS